MLFLFAAALALQTVPPGEDPVDPYTQSDTNAGAKPFKGDKMWKAFHGQAGVDRIVDDLIDRSEKDSRIAEIFKGQDLIRLRRTLKEQFCYILSGGCHYTGRSMTDAHKDMGLQTADFNALVENLQTAMRREHVAFFAQNSFLAKLAPMKRTTVQR
jgi:hemoglobin